MFHHCNHPIRFRHFEHLELPRRCIVTWHLHAANSKLRRISCYGRNHSHTRCEYSKTIFLCYHHRSEYSLLGSKFSICYSQRVNATSQYNDSGSRRCSKWPNDRMVAVVKHCWLLVQGRRGCRERWLIPTSNGWVFKKILACSVSRRVIVIA